MGRFMWLPMRSIEDKRSGIVFDLMQTMRWQKSFNPSALVSQKKYFLCPLKKVFGDFKSSRAFALSKKKSIFDQTSVKKLKLIGNKRRRELCLIINNLESFT